MPSDGSGFRWPCDAGTTGRRSPGLRSGTVAKHWLASSCRGCHSVDMTVRDPAGTVTVGVLAQRPLAGYRSDVPGHGPGSPRSGQAGGALHGFTVWPHLPIRPHRCRSAVVDVDGRWRASETGLVFSELQTSECPISCPSARRLQRAHGTGVDRPVLYSAWRYTECRAVAERRVHEPLPALAVIHRSDGSSKFGWCREPLRRVGDRDLEHVTRVDQQRVAFGKKLLTSASCGLGGPVGTPLSAGTRSYRLSQLLLQVPKLKLHSRLSMSARAPLGHATALAVENGCSPAGTAAAP